MQHFQQFLPNFLNDLLLHIRHLLAGKEIFKCLVLLLLFSALCNSLLTLTFAMWSPFLFDLPSDQASSLSGAKYSKSTPDVGKKVRAEKILFPAFSIEQYCDTTPENRTNHLEKSASISFPSAF